MINLQKPSEFSYQGNPHVKRDGVIQEYTLEESKEYARCLIDPVYFCEKYLKIISLDEGLVNFELYDYQRKMFDHFNNNRFSVVLACRQSGKSISSVGYILWYAIFQSEKTVAIVANKGATAREMLSRITLMLENLPYFLQPGCRALNKGWIDFSNNSRIVTAGTTGSSIRGMSVNLLFLDEFAFVIDANTFYTSTYPVITAGKSTKVIITSTANGVGNVFHKIWEGAVQGINDFKPYRVDWWDVPGRDEAWKQTTIANTSPLQFDQEFGNSFIGTGDTLISAEVLLELRARPPLRRLENNLLNIYYETRPSHEYIMVVDVSKGRGQDYSTFTIIDISERPFKQVAVYRNNSISPILFPNVIYKYAKVYNECYVVIEANDQGGVVCNGLYHELEYENVHMSSAIKADSIGIEMNRKTKRLGCSGIKDIMEERKLDICDENTIMEMSTFVAVKQSYEASGGNHDDLMMNLVMFGYFVTTQFFSDMTDIDLKQLMFEQKMIDIDNDVVPFGYFDDGSDAIEQIERLENDPFTDWQLPHHQAENW